MCQCAKHTWAHGDGNLRVFRVVPERRPNRRKVLAPTSAPEGGTTVRGSAGRARCGPRQMKCREPKHSNLPACPCSHGGYRRACSKRNPPGNPPKKGPPLGLLPCAGAGGGIRRASRLMLLLRVQEEADALELLELGRSAGMRFEVGATRSLDEASDRF